ncbi:hypothetical protein T484DRAFT_1786409, partial [Baffinella frigidus]
MELSAHPGSDARARSAEMGVEVQTSQPGDGKNYPKRGDTSPPESDMNVCSHFEKCFASQGDTLQMHYTGTLASNGTE